MTTIASHKTTGSAGGKSGPPVPPLQTGDRLTREEFERRFDATPGLKKAELIEGVVYMPPPVSQTYHSGPHFDVIGWLFAYRIATPGVAGGDNGSIRLDLDNEPQPDGFLYILPEHGGQAKLSADGYVEGAPELVAEVAASSASYDLHVKLNVYRRNGVREYVVWRVYERAIDWFVLRGGRFEALTLSADGLYRSETFPGLWLHPAALLQGDMPVLSQSIQRGLASPEHLEFVQRLNRTAGGA